MLVGGVTPFNAEKLSKKVAEKVNWTITEVTFDAFQSDWATARARGGPV